MKPKPLLCLAILSLSLFSLSLSTSFSAISAVTHQSRYQSQILGVIYVVTSPKITYDPGEPIHFHLQITNTNPHSITFSYSGYSADYEIISPPLIIYRTDTSGYVYQSVIITRTLTSGETWTISFLHPSDDYFLSPGVYSLHAFLVRYGHASLTIIVGSPLILAIPLLVSGCMVLFFLIFYRRKKRKIS